VPPPACPALSFPLISILDMRVRVGRRGGRGQRDHRDFAAVSYATIPGDHRGFAGHLRPCCSLGERAWPSFVLGFDTLAGSGSSLL